jgi:hypothetical protein
MGNPSNDLLEKAVVLGLAAPAAAMVGSKAASLGKPNSYESEKEYRDRIRGKNYGAIDKEDKLEEIRRSMEPPGGDNKSTGTPKVMKKGGSVSSASKRADGCCVKGKTRGRMV